MAARRRSPAQRAVIASRTDARRRAGEQRFLASVNLSAAQRDQGAVNVTDLALAARAQLLRPGVRWWWGARTFDGHHGAYCYLCGAMIAGYSSLHPITRQAQDAILAHRDQAHAAGSVPQGSETPARSAGADQSRRRPAP